MPYIIVAPKNTKEKLLWDLEEFTEGVPATQSGRCPLRPLLKAGDHPDPPGTQSLAEISVHQPTAESSHHPFCIEKILLTWSVSWKWTLLMF